MKTCDRKVMKNLMPFILTTLLLLASCSSTALPANSKETVERASSAVGSTDASMPPGTSAAEKTSGTGEKAKVLENPSDFKPIYREPAQPMPEEPRGVVYKGYLLDYYEALYGPLGPVSLANACRSLDIKMTSDSPGKAYDYDWSPETINLEKAGKKLVLKLSGNRDDYYKEHAYPYIPYSVFKDGREISFKSVFANKGCTYISSLAELLAALDISYFESGGNIYVGSDKAAEVKGRILDESETKLEKGKKAGIRLVYNYDAGNKPGYGDIELQLTGKEGRYVKIFDKARRGRYDYYFWGTVSEYPAGKDHFLKVDLAGAYTDGKVDSYIYKIGDDMITPVYATGFSDWSSEITVETDGEGDCTFRDRDIWSPVNRPLDIKLDRPDTIFLPETVNTYVEVDPESGGCTLTELESFSCKKPFLFIALVKKYNGDYFSDVKNILSEAYMYPGNTDTPLYEYDMAIPPAFEDTAEEYRVLDKLGEITIENLNGKSDAPVSLVLPKGWYAKSFIRNIAEGFEFKSPKNRHITKAWSYELYNTNAERRDFYQYGTRFVSGTLDLTAYYRDQPEYILRRNHAQIREKVWSGQTILGKGDIYIVDCDLPREMRTEDHTTYDEVYAWIPVEGEDMGLQSCG